MTDRILAVIVTCVALSCANCRSDEPLPHLAKTPAEDVTIAQLISSPTKFDGSLVRVIAPCTIAFEGNALHLSEDDLKPLGPNQYGKPGHAIWLDVGWPVSPQIRALHHKYVLVEGQFDFAGKGHMGQYVATIKDVRRIEESSSEAEREVRRRLDFPR